MGSSVAMGNAANKALLDSPVRAVTGVYGRIRARNVDHSFLDYIVTMREERNGT